MERKYNEEYFKNMTPEEIEAFVTSTAQNEIQDEAISEITDKDINKVVQTSENLNSEWLEPEPEPKLEPLDDYYFEHDEYVETLTEDEDTLPKEPLPEEAYCITDENGNQIGNHYILYDKNFNVQRTGVDLDALQEGEYEYSSEPIYDENRKQVGEKWKVYGKDHSLITDGESLYTLQMEKDDYIQQFGYDKSNEELDNTEFAAQDEEDCEL